MLLRGSVPSNVDLVLENPDDEVVIEGNHTELQQCLLNLCLNALQAMPEGGNLTLSAEPADDRRVILQRRRTAVARAPI